MSIKKDKQTPSAAQIKQKQTEVIDDIERLKETADAETLKDLEAIEQRSWSIVMDLDEIARRENKMLVREIEENSILARMRGTRPERPLTKIGNYVV